MRYSYSGVNIGFIAIRNNEHTKRFWTRVSDILTYTGGWEQQIVNDLLYAEHNEFSMLRWDRFDKRFWNQSQGINELQTDQVILHHANCAITLNDKFQKMDDIKRLVVHN